MHTHTHTHTHTHMHMHMHMHMQDGVDEGSGGTPRVWEARAIGILTYYGHTYT